MARPLYRNPEQPALKPDGHRGLWHERFFDSYVPSFTAIAEPSEEQPEQGKLAWLKTVGVGKAGDGTALAAAGERLTRLCLALGGETCVAEAGGHFVTGLGNPHPVENGFLWHPTLGVPYLQGSSVKGLVRAWVEEWTDEPDDARHARLYRWFGSEHKNPVARRELRKGGFRPPSRGNAADTEAGGFIFFDALPVSPVRLKPDVMTPHMGDWYESGDKPPDREKAPGHNVPGDWHSPLPVTFLVADSPRLLFCIAPRHEAARAELAEVVAALESALEWLGAGAKTAAGYGHFSIDAKREALRRAQARAEAEERAKAAADAALTENQRLIVALRELFAKTRAAKRRENAGSQLYRNLRDLLNAATDPSGAGGWTRAEQLTLAELVASEVLPAELLAAKRTATLNLDTNREKEIKKMIRTLRGEA